jgi:hypothetical protein
MYVYSFNLVVSLPRGCFQEIECMMVMNFMHGLFLTCTQRSCLYLHDTQLINIYTTYNIVKNTLYTYKKSPSYLEGQCLAHGGKSQSTMAPRLLATAPSFDSHPS